MSIRFSLQSVSDVITNSSTEIYTVWNSEQTEETIKGIVNNLLELGNTDLTFDDLFIFKMHWCGEEDYEDYGFNSVEEYRNYFKEHSGWDDRHDRGVSNFFEIKTKPEAEKLINVKKLETLLNSLDTLFDSDYYDN